MMGGCSAFAIEDIRRMVTATNQKTGFFTAHSRVLKYLVEDTPSNSVMEYGFTTSSMGFSPGREIQFHLRGTYEREDIDSDQSYNHGRIRSEGSTCNRRNS